MKFVTLADLAATIRRNVHKIPHDVDFVIGVPRSGVIAAGIIAEFLNAPLIDVDSFAKFGALPTGGRRSRFHRRPVTEKPRVLVVDDTIFHGWSLRETKNKLAPFARRYGFEFVYMAVFLEGPNDGVDIWLEDLRRYTDGYTTFVLYEWNIFHHVPKFMGECIYDIDGVLCLDPPDERSGRPYMDYIPNAVPLFTPTVKVGELVTYRLERYRDLTEWWLHNQGVTYGALTMFPAKSYDERAGMGISPAAFKADIYRLRPWAKLFVESDDRQAREIYGLTGKPVYSVETNKIYE